MKINNLLPQNNQTKPTFNGLNYFHQVKALPDMVCGCCGRKTLNTDKFVKAVIPLSKPLSVQKEKGVLNYLEWKYPKAWETIKSFTERFPECSLDEIIHDKNGETNDSYVELKKAVVEDIEAQKEIHNFTTIIERDRFVNKTFYDLADHGRAYMLPSAEVIKQLLPLKQYLTGVKKEVFEQLEIYSRKFPEKTLSEIISIPQIRQFHSTKNILQRTETREKLDYHFENILLMVEQKNPEAVEAFQKLKEDVLDMFENENDPKRRIYLAEKMYKEALEQHNCESLEKKVFEELKQVPESFLTKDSFFNHAANKDYNDSQIITALFGYILASEEHVQSIHDGGKDITGNKIIMCRECNSKRKSIPYREFIKYHTDMPKNIQKQLDVVAKNILKGNLSDKFIPYPINVAENIVRESEGAINPDVTDYCEKMILQSEEIVAKNTQDIAGLNAQRAEIQSQIIKLKNSNIEEQALQQDLKSYLEKNK